MIILGFAFLLYVSLHMPMHRSKANPAVAFTTIWLMIGVVVEASPYFISIPFLPKLYILFNSALFVSGVFIGNVSLSNDTTSIIPVRGKNTNLTSERLFNAFLAFVGVVLLSIGLDVLIYWYKLASAVPEMTLFFSLARGAALQGESILSDLSYLHRTAPANLFIFSVFLIVTGRFLGPWRIIALPAIILTLLLTTLEGARSGFFQFFSAYACLFYLLGIVRLRGVAIIVFIATALFMGSTLLMRAGSHGDLSLTINHILIYVFSPTPLFGEWFSSPVFNLDWPGFFEFLNKIGIEYKNDFLIETPFLSVGTGLNGFDIEANVYTAFAVVMDNLGLWSYLYWFFFGFVAGVIHARCTRPLVLGIYSLIFPAILLTIFSEYFFSNLNLMVRMTAGFVIFYSAEFILRLLFKPKGLCGSPKGLCSSR